MRATREEWEEAVGEELLIKAIATEPSALVKETFTAEKKESWVYYRHYQGWQGGIGTRSKGVENLSLSFSFYSSC